MLHFRTQETDIQSEGSETRHLLSPSILDTLGSVLAKVYSGAIIGLDGAIVEVEVDAVVQLMERLAKLAESTKRG